jgi:hypothetical protein
MGRDNWKTALAAGSAVLAVLAVWLVAAAVLGRVEWSAVIGVAAAAVAGAAAVLAVEGDVEVDGEGRHQ